MGQEHPGEMWPRGLPTGAWGVWKEEPIGHREPRLCQVIASFGGSGLAAPAW